MKVLGTNGIFVLTGVPGLQAFIEADPARLMRDMVLITGRYPPQQAPDLILGRPTGIKNVITFDETVPDAPG